MRTKGHAGTKTYSHFLLLSQPAFFLHLRILELLLNDGQLRFVRFQVDDATTLIDLQNARGSAQQKQSVVPHERPCSSRLALTRPVRYK